MPESPDDNDDVQGAPCACVLVARAVTLMTEWADPSTGHGSDLDTYRTQLARQLLSDLYFLRNHPGFSAPLRQAMAHAHQRWVALARSPSNVSRESDADGMLRTVRPASTLH